MFAFVGNGDGIFCITAVLTCFSSPMGGSYTKNCIYVEETCSFFPSTFTNL